MKLVARALFMLLSLCCLLCAEERGAKLAIDAVRSGDFDVFRGEAWATAEAICARDRGKR